MAESVSISRPDKGQSLAIHHGAGPMLVLAGPGSGKTHVITHRIRYLISECNIPPNEILVITFTKAAALEMQARANLLIKQSAYVQFGTFHSVFYQILKKSRTHCKFTLVSDRERIQFIKEVLESTAAGEENPEAQADRYIKEISRRKNMLPGKESMEAGSLKPGRESMEAGSLKPGRKSMETGGLKSVGKSMEAGSPKLGEESFETVLQAYDEWLKEAQKLDFDDMLRLCYFYLRDNPAERKKWQKRFSFILIDEFQDINPLQYETIKLLSGNGNLFAVGDDDQAIYGFRGADPLMMKQFQQEFGAEVVRLSVNYRCSGRITEAAGRFIENNGNRFPKEITPFKEPGEEICIRELSNRQEELAFLRESIKNYQKEHPEKTQAVLARTNGMLEGYMQLSEALSGTGKNPLWEDVAAYLTFINCGRKRGDFLKIMNKPMRYIGRNVLTEPVVDFKRIVKRLSDKPWIQRRVRELEKQVDFAAKLDLRGQLYYIWKALGYGQYVEEQGGGYSGRIKENAAWFAKLLSAAEGCDDFLELQAVMKESQPEKQTNEMVHMLTYHGAKGLEFDRVYLPDLNYGRVPHGRMLTKEELEEERRMFYVAMTRAKESLVLLHIKSQTGSPFLLEI